MSNTTLQILDKIPHHLKFISQKHYDHAKHCGTVRKMQVLHRSVRQLDRFVDSGIFGVVGSWELRSLYRLYYISIGKNGNYFCVRYDNWEEKRIACRSARRSFCKHIFFFLLDLWIKFTSRPNDYNGRIDLWIRRAIHKVPMFHYRQGRVEFHNTLSELRREFENCDNYRSEWDEHNNNDDDKPKSIIARCHTDYHIKLYSDESDLLLTPELVKLPVNKVQRKRFYSLQMEETSIKCFSCGKLRIEIAFKCVECDVSYCKVCRDIMYNGDNVQCLNPSNRGRAHNFV